MSKNTKDLTVFRVTVLDKIRNFFKKLFSKKYQQIQAEEDIGFILKDDEQTETSKSDIKAKIENDFINNVKINEDDEEKRLMKLQDLIAEEVITEEELPEEDIKALHKLYDKQILELKKSIDEYKQKIMKLRMNINE